MVMSVVSSLGVKNLATRHSMSITSAQISEFFKYCEIGSLSFPVLTRLLFCQSSQTRHDSSISFEVVVISPGLLVTVVNDLVVEEDAVVDSVIFVFVASVSGAVVVVIPVVDSQSETFLQTIPPASLQ